MATKFKKGFTLLEILIATGVFALVMLMTTGIVSQSAGYQSKIKAIRQTSEESSHLSDMLARDLRAATGSFALSQNPTSPTKITLKNGVALIKSAADSSMSWANINSTSAPQNLYPVDPVPEAISDVIIISQKNDAGEQVFKIYANQPSGAGPYTSVAGKTVSISTLAAGSTPWYANGTLSLTNSAGVSLFDGLVSVTDMQNLETYIDFSGYTRVQDSAVQKQQSYVAYVIHSKTKNFDTLTPSQRAETTLRSMITMRNYAQ